MRRRVLGIAAAAAIGAMIVAGLSLREGTPSVSSQEQRSRPTYTFATGRQRVHVPQTPPPSGSLRIRGTVKDEHGPVAGVRVSATRPTPGETLSELPCSADVEGDASGDERKLPDCFEDAGARVLELVTAREGEAPVYAETVTAADGGFVLDGLPEGDFTLWALGEQGAKLRSGVKAGAESVELVLEEGFTLEGIVINQEEQPLAGVDVTILHEQHTRFFDTKSGPDGRYRIGPLPKAQYALVATREGLLPAFQPHRFLDIVKGRVMLIRPSRLVGRVLLDGAPSPDTEVSVEALRCETFTKSELRTDAEGRFTLEGLGPCAYLFTAERDGLYAVRRLDVEFNEAVPELVLNLGEAFHVEGTVRDETGQPVEGAAVTMSPDYGSLQSWHFVTKADGRYRMGPVAPGRYQFSLESEGYVDVYYEEHALKRGMEPLDLTLRRASTVAGVVVDEEGKPVQEVHLRLSRIGPDSEDQDIQGADATTDEAGRFSLDADRAGSWMLNVDADGFMDQSQPIQAPASGLRVVVRRGATVVGTLTDEQGVPQPRAHVTLWRAATNSDEEESLRSTSTDPQGRFTLEGLSPGRFVVEAKLDGDGTERTAAKPVELRGSEKAEVPLRFEEGRTLSGLVVDGNGAPIADAFVRVEVPFNLFPSWRRHILSCQTGRDPGTTTGPDGRFTLKHIVEDRYELLAFKQGYTFVPERSKGGTPSSWLRESVLVWKGAGEVRLVLERQGRIRGRVVGPDGAPLRYFTVNGPSHSDPTGTFEAPFVKSGVQNLEFAAPHMAPLLRSVKVQEGVDVELGDVRMGPGRRVKGRVVDALTGAPIAEAGVQVVDTVPGLGENAADSSSTRTGEDGTFELSRVEERPLMIEARHYGHLSARVPLSSSGDSVELRLDTGARIEVSVRDHEGKPLSTRVVFEQEGATEREVIWVRDGTGVRQGLVPGLYVASVSSPSSKSQPIFLPQRVQIPANGRVTLSFVERREGATLVLHAEGATHAFLVAGSEPLPASEDDLDRWATRGRLTEEKNGELKFEYLPAGHATLLLVSFGNPASVHLEELELPAEGVLEREVHPRWQPFPKK